MTEREAALTSYPEYLLRLNGKIEKDREKWELARWICWQQMLLSPNIKPGHKPNTAKGYCTFPWERETAEELKQKAAECRITPEQEAELNEIIKILDAD